jgi:Holliday junction resolvase RusA-like endonuclease
MKKLKYLGYFKIPGEPASFKNKFKKEAMTENIRMAVKQNFHLDDPVAEPCKLVLDFNFSGTDEKSNPDLDNVLKTVMNALKGVVYMDPRQVKRVTMIKSEGKSKESFTGLTIQILKPEDKFEKDIRVREDDMQYFEIPGVPAPFWNKRKKEKMKTAIKKTVMAQYSQEPDTRPFNLLLDFNFANPDETRNPSLNQTCKTVMDALKEVIYMDDRQVKRVTMLKLEGAPKSYTGLTVQIIRAKQPLE